MVLVLQHVEGRETEVEEAARRGWIIPEHGLKIRIDRLLRLPSLGVFVHVNDNRGTGLRDSISTSRQGAALVLIRIAPW